MNEAKGTQVVKQLNRARVLGLLREGPTNRAALAKALDLSKNTVSLLIDDLIGEGLVTETGPQESGVGRPAIGIELNPKARLVVGVQYRQSGLHFVVAGLDAVPVEEFVLSLAGTGPDAVVAAVQRGMEDVTSRHASGTILGLGFGIPGLVDSANRTVLFSRIGWREVALAAELERAVGLPSFVLNNQRAAVMAELWYGEGRGLRNFVYCSLGTGVGGGLVINREMYQGHMATAGEIGHITILPEGPLCSCGNHGCLEALVGEAALVSRARELMRVSDDHGSALWGSVGGYLEHLQAAQISRAALAGDAVAEQVVTEAAGHLASGLGSLINVFNPEAIIITCQIPDWQQALEQPLEQALQRRALHVPLHACRLTWSRLGPRAGAIGAAALVLTRTGWSF